MSSPGSFRIHEPQGAAPIILCRWRSLAVTADHTDGCAWLEAAAGQKDLRPVSGEVQGPSLVSVPRGRASRVGSALKGGDQVIGSPSKRPFS